MNRPFTFDVHLPWLRNDKINATLIYDEEDSNIHITLDMTAGKMSWCDPSGAILFAWEKNARVTSSLDSQN